MTSSHVLYRPGLNITKFGKHDVESTYSEGQIVGYRWYDKNDVEPAFAFGHGQCDPNKW